MFSLFSRKPKKDLSLIIDIQSGLVRGALVSFSPTEAPRVVYIVSKPLSRTTIVDGSYLTTMMLKAVEEVAYRIAKEGLASPEVAKYSSRKLESIQYVVSSPWVISQSQTVKMEYTKDTEINEATIHGIVEKEKNALMSKFKEGDLDEKYESDLTLIEQKVFDVRLNGYSVQDYKGKKARNFEMTFAMTTSSKYILGKIEEAVLRSLHAKKTSFHSALLLHYAALRTLLGNREEYVSVHVHSELTDIIVVKRGLSSCLASFPYGTTTLTRELSQGLSQSEESASSLLSMYHSGKLEASEHQRFENAFKPLLSKWEEQVLLSTHAQKNTLPRLVYLSAHAHDVAFTSALVHAGLEVFPFDDTLVDKAVVFDKPSMRSSLVGMYSLALNGMV